MKSIKYKKALLEISQKLSVYYYFGRF